ncbi:acetylhydrolase [Paenibacillus sp. CAA11]|uniref:alpha/beta hydrolase n=1 Tax=Paenibacillus sp. CAA11 TaxID=1532905 RepID=UPI000D397202|nr:dienelactone hydrolase family protein [Paenibacillus sp. CAA11]AWB44919.1 acetylhydrolase [Paenibacillus sp. CAA11]
MRPLEIALAVINFAILAWLLFYPKKAKRMLLAGFAISVAATLLQCLMESLRWEMTFVYVIGILPLAVWIRRKGWRRSDKESNEPRQRRSKAGFILRIVGAVLLAGVGIVVPTTFPVFSFSPLDGPYKIGTVSYLWTDSSREQVHTGPGTQRELMVQIWYPADANATGETAPYVEHPAIFTKAISKNQGLPEMFYSSLKLVKTHSIPGVALANHEAKYPVIVYSHGNMGWRSQSTFLTESLVSHGYIVIAIDYVGSSNVTVFPDGRVFKYFPDAGHTLGNSEFDRLVDQVWIKDTKFVLDQIEQLNTHDKDGRFTGRLDLDRIGMLGYSLGGATTVQTMLTDERVKAGINMDGGFFGKHRAINGLNHPFMLISADSTFTSDAVSDKELQRLNKTRADYEATISELMERQKHAADGGNYVLTVKRSDHTSFSDFPLYSPLLSRLQGIAPQENHRVIKKFVLAFFDEKLKGASSSTLQEALGDHSDYKLYQGR